MHNTATHTDYLHYFIRFFRIPFFGKTRFNIDGITVKMEAPFPNLHSLISCIYRLI